MAESPSEQLALEQIEHLRRLARAYTAKAMAARSNPRDLLDALFAVQHELENWSSYLSGEPTGRVRYEPPAPFETGMHAPPLDGGEENDLDHNNDYGETGLKMPPEPLWADERVLQPDEER